MPQPARTARPSPDASAAPVPIADRPLDRPIRVVMVCGPQLEEGMARFAQLLDDHPDVDLVEVLCHSPGIGPGDRWSDLRRRRGLLAPALALAEAGAAALRWLLRPGAARRRRRALGHLRRRVQVVRDVHDPSVLERVRALRPDLGVMYGGPILRPELFRIPRLGTLGIHHGTLPAYRGKKTTFWELHEGEPWAGVTIQRVNEGLDTGEVVESARIPALGRSYRRVWREVEEAGLELYLRAVVGAKRATATATPPRGAPGPLRRDPRLGDLLRFYGRRAALRLRVGPTARAGAGRAQAPDGGARPVLLLTESYHPMVGGGEVQARALGGRLASAGHPVTVLTRRWDPAWPARTRLDGVEVERLGPSGPGHLKKWGLVATLVPALLRHRGGRPTVLVCGFRVMGITAALLGPCLGMRVTFKADSPGELSGEFFAPGLARYRLSTHTLPVRAILGLRNRILRRAHAFVAVSTPLAEELERHGVPPAQIRRIPNGVDLARFSPAGREERLALRRDLDLPIGAPVAVYTGRLVSYKGLRTLVGGWERVAEQLPEARLLLVGGGSRDIHDCEQELRRTVEAKGLTGRVTFTGEVPDVAPYLRASDIFVFPSEREAFGLAVAEAMACGLPVVATRAGGLADVIGRAEGTVAVGAGEEEELAAALGGLLADPAGCRRLGRASRRWAEERYGMEAVAGRYLALLAPEGEAG